VVQATFLDCLFLDLLSHPQNVIASTVIDVGGRQVTQALVIALVVVVLVECPDLAFKIARQAVVFQQNTVLHHLVPSLNLALGLRVMWCALNVVYMAARLAERGYTEQEIMAITGHRTSKEVMRYTRARAKRHV